MKDIDAVSQEFSFITKEQRKNYSLEKDRKLLVTKRVSYLSADIIIVKSFCDREKRMRREENRG